MTRSSHLGGFSPGTICWPVDHSAARPADWWRYSLEDLGNGGRARGRVGSRGVEQMHFESTLRNGSNTVPPSAAVCASGSPKGAALCSVHRQNEEGAVATTCRLPEAHHTTPHLTIAISFKYPCHSGQVKPLRSPTFFGSGSSITTTFHWSQEGLRSADGLARSTGARVIDYIDDGDRQAHARA